MKHLVLVLAALFPLAAMAQKNSSLTATLSELTPGELVVLSEPQAGHLVPVDTLIVDGRHSVTVKRQIEEPWFFILSPLSERSQLMHCMLMPREKVRLTAVRGTDPRSFHLQSVRGSDNMELYGRVYDVMNSSATSAEKDRQIEQLLRDNKSLLMSAFLVTYFENAFEQYAPLYKELRDALIGTYPKSDFVLHLDQRVRSVVMVGMEAPDIVMADSTGKARRLSDLRGKVVLIDFWASWCRPCRAENPNVVRLYHKYASKGFEIFSVSLDNSRERWLQAIHADGLVWPNHVSDLRGWSSAAGRLYGISSIPATVLVDRDGKVLARNLRGPQLEDKLKEIFGE